MMRFLLENYFGRHYNSTKAASVNCRKLMGVKHFADPKACADCKMNIPGGETQCDKVVLKCDFAQQEVEVIELELFIDNYSNLKAIGAGQRCDLLLLDEIKIVFCDMTCSRAKYIEPYQMRDGTAKIGKRNTVRTQIANSILLLHNVPEIAYEIDKRTEKIGLFAYREKPALQKDEFDNSIVNKMDPFKKIEDAVMREPMYAELGNGFVFTEIKYPAVYTW